MIFRRFSEPTPAPRKTTAPQAAIRREPSVNAKPMTNNQLNAQAQNGPVSPIAAATARRTQTATPANSFGGKDQSRKLTVGRDISLNGEITTCDHLVVEGTIRATIKDGKMLEISETGHYQGFADIENADIAGHFEGELIVRGKLIVRPTAVIVGTIYYTRLQVDTGAAINANMNTLIQQPQQQPAPQPPQQTAAPDSQRMFSLASLNDEPGFLRANGN